MTRMISFWVLVAIIVVVGLLFYQVMSGFLLPLFLAAMLVVIFQPIYRWILERCGGRAMIASGLTTLIVVVAVFLPMGWAITLAASQSISMARQLDINRATRQIQKLRVALNLDLPLAEDIVDLAPLIESLAEAPPVGETSLNIPADETRSAPAASRPAESRDPSSPAAPSSPVEAKPSSNLPPVDATRESPEKPAKEGAEQTVEETADKPTDTQAKDANEKSPDGSAAEVASVVGKVGDVPGADGPDKEAVPFGESDSKPSVAGAAAIPDATDAATLPGISDPSTDAAASRSTTDGSGFAGFVEPDSPRAQELLEVLFERVKEIERQIPVGEVNKNRPEVAGAITRVKSLLDALAAAKKSFEAQDKDRFARDIVGVRESFQALVAFLPGNAVRVWLKNLMNPSPARLQEYRDRVFVEIQNWLLPAANVTVGVALKLVFGTIIMTVSVFFFFADGERMTATITRLIPLDVRHQRELLEDFGEICRAVVLATLTSAAVQSVLAGLGFWMAGVESVALLMVLTMVFAMIPFVGAFAVWLPVCLWIGFVEEHFWTAVLLAIYCGIVVSQSDNIVKPLILQGRSNLHPLLALLSILGGVKALGPIGILVGPMVVVFLQTLLNILHREITSMEQSRDAAKQA